MAFEIIFLAIVVILLILHFVFGKKFKYRKGSHLNEFNDPNDQRHILNPSNPAGPNWVGEDNLFRDRHNRIADSENPSSERK